MGKSFDRVVIVMVENALRANVLKNEYMNSLLECGVFLENSYGVTHSSQPNYIASVGGDTFGICDDAPNYAHWLYTPPGHMVTSIVDLLEAKSLTWKSYAEDIPDDYNEQNAQCLTANQGKLPSQWTFPYGTQSEQHQIFPFARKHVPFLSFPNIISNADRSSCIVNASEFATDLANGTLPNYSWYTPNLINDGHSLSDTEKKADPLDQNRAVNIDNIANFLQSFLGDNPVEKFPPRTLIVVTFDEAYPYYDPYQIYTLLIGDMLPAGTTRLEPYNHYCMLRSIEDNFGLGTLSRNDAVARPYWFLE
ncbi:MAG: hypothetical protein KDA88_21940 [Planctomycetaceae bacterium]|nr:hypothetical protein [Planctomycetaceae bacterium]MCB9951948.1 hypothetical protein [Planctomycetaceae bacterium]